MKKIICVFFLLIAAFCFAGCASEEEEEEDFEYEIAATMEGKRYGSQTPKYKYGVVLNTYGNSTEDAYQVNKEDNPDAFNLYKADCIAEGFTELKTVTMEDNTYVTLSRDNLILQIFDTPKMETMNIVVSEADRYDDGNHISDRQTADNKMSLTMIGQSSGKYAMGFIYRLEDGRFIVIDGGYYNNKSADWIYNEMLRLTPEGEDIVIACWILTHSHDDHCGAYQTFAKNYYKKVTVESTMYNFGLDEQYEVTGQNYGWQKKVVEIAESNLYKNHKAILPHVGDTFKFNGLTIDFLYTDELLIGHRIAAFNATSLMFRVTVDGQTHMILADSNEFTQDVVNTIYTSETLKSDAMQVAHHGYYTNANIKPMYELINPTYVLWPSSKVNFEKKQTQELEANRFLLDSIPEENIWVCYNKVYRFDLPLTTGGYEIIDEDAEIIRPAA